MWIKIMKWLLELVDIDIDLDGDLLHLVIKLGTVTVMDKTFDLVQDSEGAVGLKFKAK